MKGPGGGGAGPGRSLPGGSVVWFGLVWFGTFVPERFPQDLITGGGGLGNVFRFAVLLDLSVMVLGVASEAV